MTSQLKIRWRKSRSKCQKLLQVF